MKCDYIDAIRGYAIVGVVAVHCLAGEAGILGAQLLGLGAKGVQLFYIMSACTLLMSYNNRKTEAHPKTNFFLRRVFRIAPLYWLAIVYFTLQFNFCKTPSGLLPTADGTMAYASHFFLLHGFSPYWMNSIVPGGWSVGVEFMFYILCPFLFFVVKTRQHALFGFALTYLVGQVIYTWLMRNPLIPEQQMWGGYMYTWLPTQLQVFMMGFYTYFTIVERKIVTKEVAFILGLVVSAEFGVFPLLFSSYEAFDGLGVNALVSLIFLGLILLVKSDSTKLLSNRIIRHIGIVSFSLYLVHFAVLHWLMHLGIDRPFDLPELNYGYRFLITLGIGTLVSTLTHRGIEQPFIGFGKALIQRWQRSSKPARTPSEASEGS